MAGPSRTLKLTYLGDASQLKKTNKDLDDDFTTLGDRFKKFGVNAAKAFAAAGAAAGAMAVKFGKDAIDSASNLNESINALEVTFDDASEGMLKLSENAAKAVGLASSDFNSLAVSFAGFTKQIANGEQDVVKVTDNLTKRVADFASVMNLEVPEAAAIFQSTLAGSSEVMRRFGIDTSAAAVTQYALENGLIASKNEMDEATRITATYELVMEQTEQMAGDFANTSDELANSQRILKAEFENAKAEAGQQLLPVMERLVDFIRTSVVPRIGDFVQGVVDLIAKFQEFYRDNAPTIERVLDNIRGAGVNVKNAFEAIATPLENIFTAFSNESKEDSGTSKFVSLLERIAQFINLISQAVEFAIKPLTDFLDLIDRVVNSRIVQTIEGITRSFYGQFGSQTAAAPTAPAKQFGLQGPARPLAPNVQGPQRSTIYNIQVNGAVDPESTARQINKLQQDAARRSGSPQSLVFTP